jgi:hypothetical protein
MPFAQRAPLFDRLWISFRFGLRITFELPYACSGAWEELEILLSDRHLQQSLSRKVGWEATSPQTYQLLERYIPNFGRSVRYLRLWNLDTWGEPRNIPEMLRCTFPMLTVLKLGSKQHVHLDILPPTLQTLELNAPLIQECNCENNLANLTEFNHAGDPGCAMQFMRILPLKSKNSLQVLQFAFPEDVFELGMVPDIVLLHQFEHLTTLRTTGHRVPLKLYRLLAESPFRLKTFDSEVPTPDFRVIEALTDLLRSPVFHDLENLRLSFCSYSNFEVHEQHMYQPFIRTMAALPQLESLELHRFPLYKGWLQLFRTSQRLKSVQWEYHSVRHCVGKYDSKALGKRLLKILTRSGGERPVVRIH